VEERLYKQAMAPVRFVRAIARGLRGFISREPAVETLLAALRRQRLA